MILGMRRHTGVQLTLICAVILALTGILAVFWGSADAQVFDDWGGGIGDATAPTTSITSGPSGTGNTNTSETFQFRATEVSDFQCSFNGGAPTACGNDTLTGSYTANSIPDGTNRFEVWATDPSGNAEATAALRQWVKGAGGGGGGVFVCPAGAIDVSTTTELQNTVSNQAGDGTKDIICVADGTYTLTSQLQPGTNDELVGEYSDTSRPLLDGNNVTNYVINGRTINNVNIENLAITGAKKLVDATTSANEGREVCQANSGRGIGLGGSNWTVTNSRIFNNPNAGIGNPGSNITVDASILEGNASDPCYYVSSTFASAGGFKSSGNPFVVKNSTVRDNHWVGVWCDISCVHFEATNNTIEGNEKTGVSFEITDSRPNPSIVSGNTIRGNGWVAVTGDRVEAEILINSASGIQITNNTFGDPGVHLANGANFNPDGRVYAVHFVEEPSRSPGILQNSITVDTNNEGSPADTYKCWDPDLTWASSASSTFALSCN